MIFICSHTSSIPYTILEPYHIILPIDYPDRTNIANKVAYRHLRGMYFIWKNLALFNYPDEITICQQRRHLKDFHIPIGYDLVLPPQDNKLPVYTQWWTCRHDPNHDMKYIEALIEVLPGFKHYSMIPNNPYARYHNMGVYPLEMYKQLCSFLFGTLRRIEDLTNLDPTGDIHTYAFLGERIADYWHWNHSHYKVFESSVVTYNRC